MNGGGRDKDGFAIPFSLKHLRGLAPPHKRKSSKLLEIKDSLCGGSSIMSIDEGDAVKPQERKMSE